MNTPTQEMYIEFPVLALVIGLVLSAYILPRMLMLSIKNSYDRRGDEIHEASFRAYHIAGLALFPVLLLTVTSSLMSPMVMMGSELSLTCLHMIPRVLSLIVGCTILFTTGLKYDLHGSSTGLRLISVLLASAVFPMSQMVITDLHGLFGIGEIPLWMGWILTILVSTVIIETFRLLDGFEVLVSSMGIVTIALFITLVLGRGGHTPVLIGASMAGVLIPFWLNKMFNPRWRSCSMGNSGNYVLGFIVAYMFLVIQIRTGNSYAGNADTMAFAILAMPLLDIIRVVGSRLRDGREILTQDKNQITHKFVRAGLAKKAAVIASMILPLLFYAFAFILFSVGASNTIVTCLIVALFYLVHYVLNIAISIYKEKTHMEEWDKTYGEDAWNANVPVEQIEAKQRAFGTMGLPPHIIQGNPLEFIPDGMSAFERNTKRIIDLIVSTGCLIIFSPLFLLSYILIKLDDGGPAIYAQERIGRFGRPFYIYKFRSMRLDAEAMGPQLSHAGGDDDPRLTKIGKFLRAHHLDELPQLWNVFTGDMAFIGYRPERKFFIDQIMEHDPRYAFLYQIRPGVTSYATLYNGYTDTMEKMLRRLELDLYYLGHRSFWLDYKVLFLTFTSIVFGKKF